jgi:hypothetical protein
MAVVTAASMAVWSDRLKALLPAMTEQKFQHAWAPAVIAALGLASLVVAASYFRQFTVISRLIQSTGSILLSAIFLGVVIAFLGFTGSQREFSLLDYQSVAMLLAPTAAFVVPRLKASSFIRLRRPTIIHAIRDWPLVSAGLVAILVVSLAATAEIASWLALPRQWPSLLTEVGKHPLLSSAYQVAPLLLASGLLISAMRCVEVSVSKVLLIAMAILNVGAIFGGLATLYEALVFWGHRPSIPSACDATAIVLCFATAGALFSVTEWRTIRQGAVPLMFWTSVFALALEIVKACLAYGMATLSFSVPFDYADHSGLVWFLPTLVPAYNLACWSTRQGDRKISPKGMIFNLVAMAAAATAYALAKPPQLLQIAALPAGLALQAAIFLPTLRYCSAIQSYQFRETPEWAAIAGIVHRIGSNIYPFTARHDMASRFTVEARNREVLVDLFRIAWPALLPAVILLGGTAAIVYDEIAKPPPIPTKPPAPPPIAVPSFFVFFDYDESQISAQAQNTIDQAVKAFRERSGARVVITGHVDGAESANEPYGMALSLRRANVVKDDLAKLGIPASAMSVTGKGGTQPLVKTATGAREPQNRRVEIVISTSPGGAAAPPPASPIQQTQPRPPAAIPQGQANPPRPANPPASAK